MRIFYPGGELPFAGHPTLGSCHAWLEAGGVPARAGKIVQECGVGLVDLVHGEQLAFKAPPFSRHEPLSAEETEEAVRLTGVDPDAVVEAVYVSNGPKWQLLRLRGEDDVLAATPLAAAPLGTDIGLAAPSAGASGVDWEIRAFFSDAQGRFREDPVTGSFNAGVAMHLFEKGLAQDSYTAAQGRKVGANGSIQCSQDSNGDVWIGGNCVTISSGGALRPFI